MRIACRLPLTFRPTGRRRALVGLVLTLAVAGCGGSDDDPASAPTTRETGRPPTSAATTVLDPPAPAETAPETTPSTTTSAAAPPSTPVLPAPTAPTAPTGPVDAPGTTAAAVPPTPATSWAPAAPVGPPVGQSTSPGEAARGLVAAWQAGDRTAAGRHADPTAVDNLFAVERGETTALGECARDGDVFSCGYTSATGGFFARVVGDAASGYRVADVTFPTD